MATHRDSEFECSSEGAWLLVNGINDLPIFDQYSMETNK